MTAPEAAVLARIRRPDIASDIPERVSATTAPSDRAPGVKPHSKRSFATIVASVENVRGSTIVRVFESIDGRLDIVMAAAARAVVGVLRFWHGVDLRAHRGLVTVAVSRSKIALPTVVS